MPWSELTGDILFKGRKKGNEEVLKSRTGESQIVWY
jgi:hypothetical protein